ncbi:MAG TPA: FimV/HubP family polar landmark protein, partial [Pseudomonadales bacterium]
MGSHAGGRSVGHNHRMKQLRAGIALACAASLSPASFALELGDVTLSSTLNEPLSASISLESLDGLAAADINVTLGDEAMYEQAGIERDPVLDDIRFSVEVDSASDGRIIVTSTSGVSEPFLNLIVNVTEPDGTATQKEYTLLLELPTNTAVPQSPATEAPQTAAAPAAVAGGNAQSYTVGPGDTLWEIAQGTRPDSSVSVQQMMLAIQRANPEAFLNGNINNLLNGRVLRIPSQQDIAVIDRDAAIAQVSQQNTGLGGQPLAAGNGGAPAGGADTRDQLRVLSGDAADAAAGGGDDFAATIAALENELMISEESLDRARIENLELNNRLAALQEQIDLLENIIAMEDDRIATLQAELVQQAEATAQALASAESAAAQIEELNNEPAAGVPGLLRNGIVLLGALVLVVLAALGLLVHRRRQAQLAAEENRFNPAFAESEVVPVSAVAADAKPGFLAGLLARFRRNRDDEADDYDDFEADALVAASPAPADGAAAYAATQDSADRLRAERDPDMTSLD